MAMDFQIFFFFLFCFTTYKFNVVLKIYIYINLKHFKIHLLLNHYGQMLNILNSYWMVPYNTDIDEPNMCACNMYISL